MTQKCHFDNVRHGRAVQRPGGGRDHQRGGHRRRWTGEGFWFLVRKSRFKARLDFGNPLKIRKFLRKTRNHDLNITWKFWPKYFNFVVVPNNQLCPLFAEKQIDYEEFVKMMAAWRGPANLLFFPPPILVIIPTSIQNIFSIFINVFFFGDYSQTFISYILYIVLYFV